MFSTLQSIDSTCANSISVNPRDNQVIVEFKSGSKFLYQNVSFEAILDLLVGEIKSVGKFVNAYCIGNNEFRLV
jgi:hypothetical protein